MIRLGLWLVWVWLAMLGLEWLHENFPLYSQFPWEAGGAFVGGLVAGGTALRWSSAREIRALKQENKSLETRVKHLESDKKTGGQSRPTPEEASKPRLAWNGHFYVTKDGDGPFCSGCWTEDEKLSRLKREPPWKELSCPKCRFSINRWFVGEATQLPSTWRRKNQDSSALPPQRDE